MIIYSRVLRSVKSSLNGFANLTEQTSSFVCSVSRCSRDQLFCELGVQKMVPPGHTYTINIVPYGHLPGPQFSVDIA